MSTKKFTCKIEEVPRLGESIVSNAERDLDDFNGYSAVFTVEYFATIRSKIEVCAELIKSTTVSKQLTGVKYQLQGKSKTFRVKLNTLDGYLKLSAGNLDDENISLKKVRTDISKGNIERLLSNMQTSLTSVRRNLPALEAQGMSPSLLDDIDSHLHEIRILKDEQNALMNKRNRLTIENIDKFNDLWHSLRLIMNAAKAIYRDVDEMKLQDYTVAILRKKR
jgi:hypothetical protein